MKIRFLGTNGWFSTASGSTACAAIILKNRLVVLDAGEGLHKAPALAKQEGITNIDIFISHLHLDHAIGLHTLPMFPEKCSVRLLAHKGYAKGLQTLLDHPYTASAKELFADVRTIPLKEGENRLPYSATALPLRHADPSWGYRLELQGKSIAYCTDTGPCENLVRLAEGADAFITECSLKPGAPELREWPHLSPEMAAMAASKAAAKLLLLTHFDALRYRNQRARKGAEKAARRIFKNSRAAHDGMEITL
ncbi:Ribonuclease Z [uncultured archaeon]|nr:Ribonuclease Z [uncultured archaeon]